MARPRIALIGGGIGPFRGGRHLRYPVDTPMTNLYLTLLDTLGVHVDAFGDSTGTIDRNAVHPTTVAAL